MSFSDAIRSVFKNYAKFDGRALRSEYWWFQLFNLLVILAAYALLIAFVAAGRSYALAGLVVVALVIFSIATFIPNLAVTVRRLHDTDKSGWYLLISLIPYIGAIILLIFLAMRGTPGTNKFGPPYGVAGEVRTVQYRAASPTEAWAKYNEDARRASEAGYEPVSQQWRRDNLGDYLEVIYHPRYQQSWQAWGATPSGSAVPPANHPFNGPPPTGSAT